MKVKRVTKSKKGAIMPLVVIILGLFALGFITLVVDLGNAYIQRKKMITAADAAALAGIQVLRSSLGINTTLAKETAEKFAKVNGAETVSVNVITKSVELPGIGTDDRQVIEVIVGKNEPTIFARFLNADDKKTNITANAAATWGFVKKTYIGSFIPLFVFDNDYDSVGVDKNVYLHDKIDDSHNCFGTVDIDSGGGDIKKAIAGNNVEGAYIYNNLLDVESGQLNSIVGAVEKRMIDADKKATPDERRDFMIGLVPVIDKSRFLELNEGKLDKSSAQWVLPIKYFAYFEIKDVVEKEKNTSKGSVYALDPNNTATDDDDKYRGRNQIGELPLVYSTDPNVGDKIPYSLIIGQFHGEPVYARTIAEIGDQVNPNPGGKTPATYSKLIE